MKLREEEFLRQIRRAPDDDHVRLIFADWLDEAGDERGELIRVQCECSRLEQTPNGHDPPLVDHYQQLARHEQELADLWRQSCLDELRPLGVRDVRFERGFVERLHVEGDAFLQRTNVISEWAPAARGLLWQKIPRPAAKPLGRLLASPVFACLTMLNLTRNALGSAGAEALARAPALGRVQSLLLRENHLGGQGIQEFAGSPYVANLVRWDLTDNNLSMVDARALARAPALHRLEELLLNQNAIGDAGLRALANCDRMKGLRSLALESNEIGQEGLRALADSAYLTDLTTLDLSGNELGDTGLSLMATASNFGRLSELKLAGCGLRAEGLKAFAASPYFNRLTSLDLSHNRPRTGLTDLLESSLGEQLQSLSLRNCDLDSQSVRPLLVPRPQLQRLDLRENPLINHYTRTSLVEQFGDRVQL